MAIHIGFQHKTVKKFVVEEDFIIMDYKTRRELSYSGKRDEELVISNCQ